MKLIKSVLPRAALLLVVFTMLCGVLYTGAITGVAQLFFQGKANGSVIEIQGVKYGSELLGQQYTKENHMWGRIMNIDVTTFKDDEGKRLMYASPSNISPASEEYEELVAQRVEEIKAANPEMKDVAIPVDLVTVSGSGLDPHISKAAAEYQVERLAKATGKTQQDIRAIVEKCTTQKFLGLFGQERVNVLKVNLMIEGIL
ncbi:MAG: potassium-transporting ATPase subunit C [Oscillospiraceae bacterium]